MLDGVGVRVRVRCNNSQQCKDVQCIMGKMSLLYCFQHACALLSPWRPYIMHVRGLNNVGRAVQMDPTCFGDHETKELLGVVG